MKKQFYSCIDALLSAPQPEQHYWIREKARRENGEIIFYGAEDVAVVSTQPFILRKLERTPEVGGVVFFTFDQFCYGDTLNLQLLVRIIERNFSVHFAREDISFYVVSEVFEKFPFLSAYFHGRAYWRARGEMKELLAQLNSVV